MIRVALALSLLGACAQQGSAALAPLQACSEVQFTGDLTPTQCQVEAGGQTLRVTFAETAAPGEGGAVTVEIVGDNGQIAQAITEENVAQYFGPSFEDIDGDGRGDILVPRMSGNVNTEYGVWIFNGERQRFERVGELSGVEFERTADGYIAAAARSSAAAWAVNFYTLDGAGLQPLATVYVQGEELAGGRIRSTCALEEAPGIAALGLSEQAAREKFCAEPVAQVFGP